MYIVLIFVLIAILYLYVALSHRVWKKKDVEYIPPDAFLGTKEIILMRESLGTYLDNLYRKTNKKFIGFYTFTRPCLLLRDVEVIKHVLVKDFQYFADKTVINNPLHDPVGSQILFIVPNPEWKFLRTKMSPAFTTGKIKGMCPLMVDVGKNLVKHLRRNDGQEINAKEMSVNYSTDVIASCAFGVEGNSFEDVNSECRKAAGKVFDFNWSRGIQFICHFCVPLLLKPFQMKFIDPSATKWVKKAFWTHVKIRDEGNFTRNDLIDTMLELCRKENDPRFQIGSDCILGQAIQFFIAGFETIGSTISFALFELSRNPDIQARLRREILEVLEKHNNVISHETMKEMVYLDMVFNETLRLYPIVPFLDRRAGINYKIPDTDVVLDKGTAVYISVLGIHKDPQYYPDPEVYNPERFSPENKYSRPNYTFLPFGEGPRNCVGARFGMQSTKVGLIHAISKFEILPSKNTPTSLTFDPRGFLLGSNETLYLKFKEITV